MVAEVFSEALKKAMERTLTVGALLGTAQQLDKAGESSLAIALYRTWIENNADNPLLHAMYFNYAVLLNAANEPAAAKAALLEAIRINPDFYPPYINLGHVLDRMGAGGEAVLQWQKVAQRLPQINGENLNYKTTALKQIARVLERGFLDPNAEEVLRQGLDINPDQSDAVQHWVSLRQRQCKWPVIQPFSQLTRSRLLEGISALSLAAYTDDPLLQMANAYRYCKHNIGKPTISFAEKHKARASEKSTKRLKIGYLSSDLREHAIGFLTAEIFGLHDRDKVEVYLYYCGIPAEDEIKARIRPTGDHWVDITPMPDEKAAQLIFDDGIDILVDINGYTNSARTKVLAMRPAPIIVNWLGFPGTVASPYHNYIIADPFIIPPEFEIYYTEKVVRLPCYQPNDRKRIIAPETPTRKDVGLPEDGVVFCCFNGVHKVTQFTWRRWMDILKAVPGSVLWLLDSIETTNARLKELAQQHGVDPSRIIYAGKRRNPNHLARYPLADIFLDTVPYGAHTTSSDALWMGVPVITLVGRGFASRVCGSLVKSAGMEELICHTPESFVALAVELGNNAEKRLEVRRKLKANRDTCVLFNTPLLVSSLEGLYAEMWKDFTSGNLPRPNLANLDVYSDIGVELDKDDVELMLVPDYNGLYEQKLAEQDSYAYLPHDVRLWTSETRRRVSKV